MDYISLAKDFATNKFNEAGIGNHFLEVFQILKTDFGVEDSGVLTAGLLHDILEDTDTTYQEVADTFGKKVADLVEEVSHPRNYNAEQKEKYYQRLKSISPEGKLIKLADFKSHLLKFIGAFTGENDLQKFTYNEYVDYILSFLKSCPDSEPKSTVFGLTKELESYISNQ